MAGPAPLEHGRLRLLEPAGSCEALLRRQLADGSYDKPFILDCGLLRFLYFDLCNIQSVMRQDNPDALCLAYTRRMMAFLLFNPRPRRILLLGLGGGSLAKFCYRHLPSAAITVLEIDPHVLALREEFRVPPDGERFRVLRGDGIGFIARRAPRADVILVDACDGKGLTPALSTPDVYSNLRRRLAIGGVLVMNICGDSKQAASHTARIRGVFGQHVITLPVTQDGNLIVLAFRAAPSPAEGARLEKRALTLEKRFGLPFPRYVRNMG
ncbi:MAG: fused MFS/spermidine synthase [Steroidobacteraceae bacterium]